MEFKELYRLARQAAFLAYAPYSGFRVGAALLTESGRVYTGVNIENSSYGVTICAERTAGVQAVLAGDLCFSALAVTASPKGAGKGADSEECGAFEPAWPCGICRQFLWEFGKDMTVITGPDEDHLEVCSLRDLLPHGFSLETS